MQADLYWGLDVSQEPAQLLLVQRVREDQTARVPKALALAESLSHSSSGMLPRGLRAFARPTGTYLVQDLDIPSPALLSQARAQLGAKRILDIARRSAEFLRDFAAVHAGQRVPAFQGVFPDNILVSLAEDCQEARFVDISRFGFGVAPGSASIEPFLPPEVRTDPGRLGPKTDIYFLGGTALYLLTGQLPDQVPLDREVKLRWKTGASKKVRYFVLSCLSPVPAHRPSVDEAATAFHVK